MPLIDTDSLTRSMTRAGSIAGIVAVVAYFSAAFLPLPGAAGRVLAFAFGPLLGISFLGIFQVIATHRDGPALRFGVAFGLMAGVAVTTMIVLQVGNNMFLEAQLADAETEAAREAARLVHKSLTEGHMLIDVVWDIFISGAGAFVGWAMLGHPGFGRVFGWSGIVVSATLLYFNLSTFPMPPASAGSIDFGPLLAVWFLVVFGRSFWLARQMKSTA